MLAWCVFDFQAVDVRASGAKPGKIRKVCRVNWGDEESYLTCMFFWGIGGIQLLVNCWFGLVVWHSRGTPK